MDHLFSAIHDVAWIFAVLLAVSKIENGLVQVGNGLIRAASVAKEK